MRKPVITAIIILCVFASFIQAGYVAVTPTYLGGSRWQHSYTITNTLEFPVKHITVWFDYGNYNNFAITSNSGAGVNGWTETIFPADDVIAEGAAYDFYTETNPILQGGSLGGFSIEFDYTGQAQPDTSQLVEVVDPTTFETLDTTFAVVPEPATLTLTLFGILALRRRTK